MEKEIETLDYNEINKIYEHIENGKILPVDAILMLYNQFPNNIKKINNEVIKHSDISKVDTKNAIKQWVNRDSKKQIDAATMPEYIQKYFSDKGIDISIDGVIRNNPVSIPPDADEDMILMLRAENESKTMYISDIAIDCQNLIMSGGYPKEWRSYDYIQRNIVKYMNDTIQEKRLGVIQPLMVSKGGYKDYTAFIDAAKIISSDNPDYVAAVLYHFVWQTKRKMTGYPVLNHMMPIFTGKQNGGKSKFINEYFLKPITGLFCGAAFSQIGDDRNVQLSTNNYVIFCDEMIGANKTENNVIKNAVSRETITYRPMGTNASVTVKNNVTFIGASNESLADIIRDDTGARRFPIINYGDAAGYDAPWQNPDFAKINWEVLWRNVNPADDSVFEKHPDLFTLTMKNIDANKYVSPFQHWMSDLSDKPNQTASKTAKSLYILYTAFMKDYYVSSNAIGSMKFYREIAKYADDNPKQIVKITDRTGTNLYHWCQ